MVLSNIMDNALTNAPMGTFFKELFVYLRDIQLLLPSMLKIQPQLGSALFFSLESNSQINGKRK